MPLSFDAHIITGSGRGKGLGSPTMNLDTHEVPAELAEGVHAVFAHIDGTQYDAVMHYGPRPVFADSLSCEVHLLDTTLTQAPEHLTVDVVGKLRDVFHFASPDDLKMQIALDIANAKKLLHP